MITIPLIKNKIPNWVYWLQFHIFIFVIISVELNEKNKISIKNYIALKFLYTFIEQIYVLYKLLILNSYIKFKIHFNKFWDSIFLIFVIFKVVLKLYIVRDT